MQLNLHILFESNYQFQNKNIKKFLLFQAQYICLQLAHQKSQVNEQEFFKFSVQNTLPDSKVHISIIESYFIVSMKSLVNIVLDSLPTKRINIIGSKHLMMSSVPYYLLFAILVLALRLLWTNAWILMVIIYMLLPLLDQIFSLDQENPTQSQRKQLEQNNIYFQICLYLIVIIDWVIFFMVMDYFQHFEITTWSCYNLAALLFVFSNLNAVQFAVAHQIFHKQGLFSKVVGTLHMSKNLYMHFTYEHLYGHHRRVATPEDPASAQQGITLYEFFPRTFFHSYKSVYKMQRDEENKPFYLNYAVLSIASSFGFTALVYLLFGTQATVLFLIEAFFSIFYLEAINYIEHYGLRRKKLENGQYQKVTIRHSWNASYRFTNYILFKLQRHSDHHQNSLKPYQTLLSLDESPHLPHGYTLMIIMSFFPSVWFSVMDPLVEQYKKSGVGTIKSELTTKAVEQTKKFAIKLGSLMLTLWGLALLI